jgi:hypothetical protein
MVHAVWGKRGRTGERDCSCIYCIYIPTTSGTGLGSGSFPFRRRVGPRGNRACLVDFWSNLVGNRLDLVLLNLASLTRIGRGQRVSNFVGSRRVSSCCVKTRRIWSELVANGRISSSFVLSYFTEDEDLPRCNADGGILYRAPVGQRHFDSVHYSRRGGVHMLLYDHCTSLVPFTEAGP